MVAINEQQAERILAANGVPAGADETALVARLADLGWQAQVEAPLVDDRRRGARARRYRALAFRRVPAARAGEPVPVHEHRRATGGTAEAALRRVLASVLERPAADEPPAGGEGVSPA